MEPIWRSEETSQLPLIGRETELAVLRERLLQSEVRVLTLIGAGGVGKTRLAQALLNQVRSSFAQSIWVDLAPLQRPEQVIPAIARACDVKEGASGLLAERLAEAIGSANLLLVLDNCEHVLKAKPEISMLLSRCPNLKVLATSREASRIRREYVFPVAPLQVPSLEEIPELPALSRISSVDLFVQQARTCDQDFVLTERNALLVAKLCVQMDGLPLAIILAASQIGSLQPMQTMRALNSRLSLVNPADNDTNARHNTLHTAIDWSHNLLSPAEQTLFSRLSVFRGSWSLQEAVGICCGRGLESKDIPALLDRLVSTSLVQVDRQAERGKAYRFLETVRDYARMRLRESGEEEMLQRQHRDWFLVWAEQGEPSLWGPEAPEWMDQVAMNYNDIWSAMEWCRDTPHEAQCGLRLWAAVVSFYDLKGHIADGIAMARQLLALAPEPTIERARTLLQASVLARSQGELADAQLLVEECLTFVDDLGDVFDSIGALCTIGSLEHIHGDLPRAEATLIRACASSRLQFEHEPRMLYVSLFWLGVYYCFQGQNEQAVMHLEEALSVARQQGCVLFESRILAVMGRALVGKGDFGSAESILMQGVLAAKKLKYYEIIALCFEYLGQAAWMKRRRESAGRLLGAAAALRTYVGVVYWFPDPNHPLITDELGRANQAAGRQLDSLLPEQIVARALETVELPFGVNGAPDGLTLRELEIAKLITRGLSNRQIAEQLYISRRTVDAHVQHILAKLDVNARAQVSAWYTARCSND